MAIQKFTPEQVARMFGCTVEQVSKQHLSNAAEMDRVADKARATGRKVSGFEEKAARAHAAESRRMAAL